MIPDVTIFNTAYLIELEGMNLCYLGAIDTIELPKDFEEELEEIDVLFIPVGAPGTLAPKDAHKLAVRLEPRMIIPMLYEKKDLDMFLKEEGKSNGNPTDKLTLKQKDLAGASGSITVIKEQ